MKRKILSFLLTMTLMMTSMPTHFFATQVDAQSNEPYIDLEQQTTTESAIIGLEQQTTTESAIKVEELQKYHGDGFDVDFKVTNQWTGAFNASMSISNTGKKALENWSLSFQFEHEITNIWGAEIVSHEGNTYIIKNVSYNQDILVGDSVTIGFSANWSDQINAPTNYDMLIQQEQVASKDYTMNFKVTSDWGSGFNGEISITNNTEEAIEDWTLEFDFDREITSFWTASIEEHENEHYVVKNAGYNANIKAGETLTLGFAGNPGNVENEPQNYNLIQIGQEIDYEKDTDGDKIPDYFEKILGTDPNNVDSDGDGLPDGYEYFYLGTDPTLKDSDGNGEEDGEEDFDQDGLTNVEEYKYNTDPFLNDTDKDDLKDGEEVHQYNTNPLIFDTDEDGIGDADEIQLLLDPNNPRTHTGIPDNEYMIRQDAKDDTLEKINNDNDIYSLGVSMLASNNVQKYLICDTSPYKASFKDNRAIVGKSVELDYKAGRVQEAQLSFKINSDYISTRSSYYPQLNLGLQRYCIFTYDTELNLLYPIETEYNEESCTIIADVNSIGTFCIVDLECLAYDLGLEVDESELLKPATFTAMKSVAGNGHNINKSNQVPATYEDLSLNEMQQMIGESGKIEVENTPKIFSVQASPVRQVDLVLVVDSTGSMSSQIRHVKENLVTLINNLRKENIALYVSIVDYKDITCDGINSTKVNSSRGIDFLNNPSDMLDVLSSISVSGGGDWPETVIDGLGAAEKLSFRKGASKYAFVITDADYKIDNNYGYQSIEEVTQKLVAQDIKTSVITDSYYSSLYSSLYLGTGGIMINMDNDFSTDMYNFILSKTNQSVKYNAIVSSGLTSVVLDEELTKYGQADTDKDGKLDCKEVNWDYIKEAKTLDGKGEIILPTLKTLINEKIGLSTEGLEKLPLLKLILEIQVLPIYSNPNSIDSDEDYYLDSFDDNPLMFEPMQIDDDAINDDGVFEDDGSMRMMALRTSKPEKINDADLVYEDPLIQKKATEVFSRQLATNNGESQFVIETKKNSDYKIYISAIPGGGNRPITITRIGLFGKEDKYPVSTTKITSDADGGISLYYCLKGNEKYIIKLRASGETYKHAEYNFKIEQDNWVYAPKGGIQKFDSYDEVRPYRHNIEKMYITDKMLVEAVELSSNSAITIHMDAPQEDIVNSVMRQLKLDDNKKIVKDAILTVTADLVAGSATAAAILDPEPTTKTILVGIVADGIAVYFTTSAGEGMFNWMESIDFKGACKGGNLNVIFTLGGQESHNDLWDAWYTPKYINKYIVDRITGVRTRTEIRKDVDSTEVKEYCGF